MKAKTNIRPQGRPPIDPDGEKMKKHSLRLTEALWAKCIRNGAQWTRDVIAKAKDLP